MDKQITIENGSRSKLGSCNFCNRGESVANGMNIVYPYTDVFKITGNYIAVVFCPECLDKIVKQKEIYDSGKIATALTFE